MPMNDLNSEGHGSRMFENPHVHFESSDVNPGRVILTGAWILGGTWVCAFLLFFYFKYERIRVQETMLPKETAGTTALTLPPEPRLQVSPREDLQRQIAFENAELHRYSWADRNK